MDSIETRLVRLEQMVFELQATAHMALRIALDQLTLSYPPDQAKHWIRFAAGQVGEGAPHLELAARELAEAMCSLVRPDPGGG